VGFEADYLDLDKFAEFQVKIDPIISKLEADRA
jgi:hypothetical protein